MFTLDNPRKAAATRRRDAIVLRSIDDGIIVHMTVLPPKREVMNLSEKKHLSFRHAAYHTRKVPIRVGLHEELDTSTGALVAGWPLASP